MVIMFTSDERSYKLTDVMYNVIPLLSSSICYVFRVYLK